MAQTQQEKLHQWLRDRAGGSGTFNEDFLLFLNTFVRKNNFVFMDGTNFTFMDGENFVFLDEVGYDEATTYNEKLYLYLKEKLNIIGNEKALADLQKAFANWLGYDRWSVLDRLSGNKNFSFMDGSNFVFMDGNNFQFIK
jgi:hypothetical protein